MTVNKIRDGLNKLGFAYGVANWPLTLYLWPQEKEVYEIS